WPRLVAAPELLLGCGYRPATARRGKARLPPVSVQARRQPPGPDQVVIRLLGQGPPGSDQVVIRLLGQAPPGSDQVVIRLLGQGPPGSDQVVSRRLGQE